MTREFKLEIAHRLGTGVFSLLALCVMAVIFVSTYPFDPIDYHRIELKQDKIRAGDTLVYTVFFTKHIDRVGTLSRYLVSLNGDSTVMVNSGLADSKLTDTHKVNRVDIPQNTGPGKYKIKVTVVFEYYGIRQVRTSFETPIFEVVK